MPIVIVNHSSNIDTFDRFQKFYSKFFKQELTHPKNANYISNDLICDSLIPGTYQSKSNQPALILINKTPQIKFLPKNINLFENDALIIPLKKDLNEDQISYLTLFFKQQSAKKAFQIRRNASLKKDIDSIISLISSQKTYIHEFITNMNQVIQTSTSELKQKNMPTFSQKSTSVLLKKHETIFITLYTLFYYSEFNYK